MIYFLIYECMVCACDYLVMFCHYHGGFPILIVLLALPCHFLDNHGVMGFST